MTLNGEIAIMLHYFLLILNHGRAVLLAIAELLVSNLHTAVACILSFLVFNRDTAILKVRSLTIENWKLCLPVMQSVYKLEYCWVTPDTHLYYTAVFT